MCVGFRLFNLAKINRQLSRQTIRSMAHHEKKIYVVHLFYVRNRTKHWLDLFYVKKKIFETRQTKTRSILSRWKFYSHHCQVCSLLFYSYWSIRNRWWLPMIRLLIESYCQRMFCRLFVRVNDRHCQWIEHDEFIIVSCQRHLSNIHSIKLIDMDSIDSETRRTTSNLAIDSNHWYSMFTCLLMIIIKRDCS
jgi:hypothetical protein